MIYPSLQNIHNTPEFETFINPASEIVTERTVKNPSFFSSEENNQTLFFIDSSIKTKKPSNFNKGLDGINTINEILNFSKKFLTGELRGLYTRLKKVIGLYDEEDEPISIESLKLLLKFILNIPFEIKNPTLTLNENGTFQLNLKQDSLNIITLRFKSENNLDYVIFKPSKHNLRPIILHGNMNMLDFIEYLKDLNLYKILRGA